MKKLLLLNVLLFFVCHFLKAQNEVIYESVTIGKQIWMTKNLDVDRFTNGEIIPEAKTNDEWVKAGKEKKPVWCYYENDEKKGKLYNWYAVNDVRQLAPEGWHIPTKLEWDVLENQVGTEAGKKIKSKIGWSINGKGNNKTGFSGFPSGFRYDNGTFPVTIFLGCWSKTEGENNLAWYYGVNDDLDDVIKMPTTKETGLSVRCIKD